MSKINKTKREHKSREVRQRIDTTPTARRLITLVILSIVLTLAVEGFSRMNVVKLFKYMTNRPLHYLYNNLIILTVLSFSELFRHRRAMLSLLTALTAILGIAGGIIVKERIQPLTTMDILMLGEAIKLTTIYFSWGQIIAACVFIFAVVVGLLYLITRLPKRRRVNYFRALSVFAGLLIACVCICMVGVNQGKFPRVYDNLVDAYENYGFTTCFAFTFGDKGMKQPSDYSSDTVTTVVEEIDGTDQVAVKPVFDEDDNLSRPNVIFVQLESFIDTDTIIGAEFDRDPTPNYHQLAKEWPYGELYVPSVGGGTVNVEFEVLTGMNIDYFGANEYPYSTQLADKTCESLAYALSEEGYKSTSLHNYTATFYGRNKVYGNLGFDRFVSLEYMPYVTYSKVGWAEDVVLADEIMKALSATEERDFVFAVTVESHGKYEDAYEYREGDVQIEALPEQITIGPMANYLQIIGETDEFIGLLLEKLSTFDEPTICVFYGDPLPALAAT
ncbi:MAG: sulfatase-like hydrolase/transferase, partial [Clostridia bacterium]|nr:sulfatase-like hydrolase/transferase [Clostridia bacterium]